MVTKQRRKKKLRKSLLGLEDLVISCRENNFFYSSLLLVCKLKLPEKFLETALQLSAYV